MQKCVLKRGKRLTAREEEREYEGRRKRNVTDRKKGTKKGK